MQDAVNHLTNKTIVVASTGVAAAGTTMVPQDQFNEFLITNGYGVLSYAEWMKVIGTVYILYLLLSPSFKFISKQVKKWLKRK